MAGEPAPTQPGLPRPRSATTRIAWMLAAIGLPAMWAVALVPVRDQLAQSTSLLMVVPVLGIAVAGGVWPGSLAALAAATAFAWLHTEPYGLPRIDEADDVVETLVLLGLGVVIGLLVEAARGARGASQVRRAELAAVFDVLHALAGATPDELVGRTRQALADLLEAERVDWTPGPPAAELPVLAPDGTVCVVDPQGVATRLDTSVLPQLAGLPAGDAGWFVVSSRPAQRTSLEQRRAAVTLARVVARWLSGAGSAG